MVLNLIVTECGQVKPELSKLLHQTAPPAEVSVSFAGDVLQACAIFRSNPCRYDAVFLPADLDSEPGGDASRAIAQIRSLNPYVQIVLILSYNYIPPSAAEVGSVWLLRRPIDLPGLERLIWGLRAAVSIRSKEGHRLLSLRCGRERYYVASDSVLYAKKCRRGTAVMTTAGEKIHTLKLDEFERELPWTFCRCHSSFVVNFRHAVQSGPDYILLDDGQRIPVSRAFRKNVENFIECLTKTPLFRPQK